MKSIRAYRRLAVIATLTVALAATAVPGAWGDQPPLVKAQAATAASHTSPCSEVCSGGGYGTAPPTETGPSSEVIDNGGYGPPSAPASAPAGAGHGVGGGFDWAYAAIGGGVAGLLVLAGGVFYATDRRRDRREKSQRSTIAA
jgi:hypothetical protein